MEKSIFAIAVVVSACWSTYPSSLLYIRGDVAEGNIEVTRLLPYSHSHSLSLRGRREKILS